MVLILVVMDDALAQCKQCSRKQKKYVLILVVMDDALAQQNLGYALFKRIVRLVCASQDMFLTNITYLLSECKITKN